MVLSSDVCSSDLHVGSPRRGFEALLGVWAPGLGALLHSRGASWGAPTFPRRVLGRSLGFGADIVRPEAHLAPQTGTRTALSRPSFGPRDRKSTRLNSSH